MELSWTWPGLVVIALIVAACFQGYQKGLIKELVSAFFMIFSILIVWGINPYVNTLSGSIPLYMNRFGNVVQKP